MITLIINLQDDCKARSLHRNDLSRYLKIIIKKKTLIKMRLKVNV